MAVKQDADSRDRPLFLHKKIEKVGPTCTAFALHTQVPPGAVLRPLAGRIMGMTVRTPSRTRRDYGSRWGGRR